MQLLSYLSERFLLRLALVSQRRVCGVGNVKVLYGGGESRVSGSEVMMIGVTVRYFNPVVNLVVSYTLNLVPFNNAFWHAQSCKVAEGGC